MAESGIDLTTALTIVAPLTFAALGYCLRQLFQALRELSQQLWTLRNCLTKLTTEVDALKDQSARYHDEYLIRLSNVERKNSPPETPGLWSHL